MHKHTTHRQRRISDTERRLSGELLAAQWGGRLLHQADRRPGVRADRARHYTPATTP
jgi:hypothetical protein